MRNLPNTNIYRLLIEIEEFAALKPEYQHSIVGRLEAIENVILRDALEFLATKTEVQPEGEPSDINYFLGDFLLSLEIWHITIFPANPEDEPGALTNWYIQEVWDWETPANQKRGALKKCLSEGILQGILSCEIQVPVSSYGINIWLESAVEILQKIFKNMSKTDDVIVFKANYVALNAMLTRMLASLYFLKLYGFVEV